MTQYPLSSVTPPQCPYCGGTAQLVSSSEVYGERLNEFTRKERNLIRGQVWLCRCKPGLAYVGCHPNTTKPLGTLADKGLRNFRRIVHAWLDRIWKEGDLPRNQVYGWLAAEMGMTRDECHVAMFDVAQCRAAIVALKRHPYHLRRTWRGSGNLPQPGHIKEG